MASREHDGARMRAGCKVTHVTSVHDWADARIYWKECSSLAQAGFSVSLVAPLDGRAANGQIRVIGIPRYQNRLMRMTFGNAAAFRRCMQLRSSVYHLHDPELLPLGALLRMMGRSIVMDVHEDLPGQVLSKPWIAPRLRRSASWVAKRWEGLASVVADRVVVAEPGVHARFPGRRTALVQNFPKPEEFAGDRVVPYADRPNRVTYVGGIAEARGVLEMVRAVQRVDVDIILALGGDFASTDLEMRVRAEPGWQRTAYLGWLSREGVAGLLMSSRVGLVVLHGAPNYVDSQPTKLFEYMLAGLPVVASDFPRWRTIVDGAGCGIMVDPRSTEEIATALGWLLGHPTEAEEMGLRGREAALRDFTWATEERRLIHMYDDLFQNRRRRHVPHSPSPTTKGGAG